MPSQTLRDISPDPVMPPNPSGSIGVIRGLGTGSPRAGRQPAPLESLLPGNSRPTALTGLQYGRGHSRRDDVEDNVPPRFELFLLGDGEKKVTETPDTRIPNSSIFTFNKEDHTLGNMLRSRLLQSPHVGFAGYKVPHPLFSSFDLRIQTDGTLTPRAALVQTCRDLVNDLSILSREFTKEWELRKMVGDTTT